MTTVAQVREAERLCQLERLQHGKSLAIREAGASEEDLRLARRVAAAAMGDGASYDKALADLKVNTLFLRGILQFGGAAG